MRQQKKKTVMCKIGIVVMEITSFLIDPMELNKKTKI